MNVVRFTNGASLFEMNIAVEQDASLPSEGDACISASAESNGFAGACNAWVGRNELSAFLDSLVSLSKTLRGEARLESMSPQELSISISGSGGRGHFSLKAVLGQEFYCPESRYWHSASFGFTIEPEQLAAQVALLKIGGEG